jgi:hypothetical protein
VGLRKIEDLKSVKTVCDGSVFPAAVLPTATVLQTSAVLQSVSEWVQNWIKFSLTCHKSTFFLPEEAAPWLAKTQTTRQSFCVSTFWCLHLLDQLCNSIVY